MLEAFVSALPVKVQIREVEKPTPNADEVLIKVVVSGTNPKDWKHPVRNNNDHSAGDDIAGIVESVGSSVYEFKPGDRVAAFHVMGTPHGSFAQYGLAPASTTFHLPAHVSFEEAATFPLASMTAAIALYQHLGLPLPWTPMTAFEKGTKPPAVLIYGGATSVGAFALKFAKLSGASPIITVAGNGIDFVKSLNAADVIVDYRKKNVVGDIKAALGGTPLYLAFDAVSEGDSWKNVVEVLTKEPAGRAKLTAVTGDVPNDLPGVVKSMTYVATAYGGASAGRSQADITQDREFAYAFYRYMSFLLTERRLTGHPYEVLPGGLNAVEKAVQMLYDRKVSAKKLLLRIDETS